MLSVRQFGDGPQLVALHGFTLTGSQFRPLAGATDRAILAPDLPGHGESATNSTTIQDVIDTVSDVIAATPRGTPVLGYSQGARIAVLVAVQGSADGRPLVLISGNAGVEDGEERQLRIQADRALANSIRIDGLELFLDKWTKQPMTSTVHLTDAERAVDRSIRSTNTADGLANALIGYGQGAQPSVWNELHRVSAPVLLISGKRDTKYSGIAERMMGLLPNAELATVKDAGHDPVAEQLATTSALIRSFLDRNS